jgi:ADP-ribosylglycohydrolase
MDRLRVAKGSAECVGAIENAVDRAATAPGSAEELSALGKGWVAEEALAMSIYCALVASDFVDGVLLAVNHGGDSDSTGAITGNILGAFYGIEALPD